MQDLRAPNVGAITNELIKYEGDSVYRIHDAGIMPLQWKSSITCLYLKKEIRKNPTTIEA